MTYKCDLGLKKHLEKPVQHWSMHSRAWLWCNMCIKHLIFWPSEVFDENFEQPRVAIQWKIRLREDIKFICTMLHFMTQHPIHPSFQPPPKSLIEATEEHFCQRYLWRCTTHHFPGAILALSLTVESHCISEGWCLNFFLIWQTWNWRSSRQWTFNW